MRVSGTMTKLEKLEIILADKEPKCPDCGAKVDRPKCLFELAPNACPRHPLRDQWIVTKRIQERAMMANAQALLAIARAAKAVLDDAAAIVHMGPLESPASLALMLVPLRTALDQLEVK